MARLKTATEKVNQIIDLLKQEVIYKEIETITGISQFTIHRIAKENGIERKAGAKKGHITPNKTPLEKELLIKKEIEGGLTYSEISKLYSISGTAISRIKKSTGAVKKEVVKQKYARTESSIIPFRNRAKVSSESFIESAF